MGSNQKLLTHMAEFAKMVFDENDEMVPMWLLEDKKGLIQPIVTPFSDKASKARIADLVREAIKTHRAVRYGFMSEAWSVILNKGQPGFEHPDLVMVPNHPDRREIIKLVVADDQGGHLFGEYFILRPEHGRPRLSPFHQQEDPDGGIAGGIFVNLFQNVH